MSAALAGLTAMLPPDLARTAGIWVAALLTLAVLSYILGDNPLFRVAQYLFVGVAAGYAASLAWTGVLWPRLQLLLLDPAMYWHYGVFFVLGLLLLARGSRYVATLASLPLGVLFGTGAALALGGTLTGSLVPQVRATIVSVSPADYGEGLIGWAYAADAVLLIVGTISVLAAFHFSAGGRGFVGAVWRRALVLFGGLGRALMMVTFGALLAGALLSFFSVLNSRLAFLLNDWLGATLNVGF